MQLSWGKNIFALILLGAIVGTALDAFHAHNDVERYPSPALFGVAWWVPLLFGAAAVSIAYSHVFIDALLHQRRSPQLVTSLAELAWLVLAYLISAGTLDTLAKTGLLLLIYLNFWLLAGRTWQNLVFSIATAITGMLIEMILVSVGAFAYVHPDFLGVPYWLPCLYACASLAVGDVGRSLIHVSEGYQ